MFNKIDLIGKTLPKAQTPTCAFKLNHFMAGHDNKGQLQNMQWAKRFQLVAGKKESSQSSQCYECHHSDSGLLGNFGPQALFFHSNRPQQSKFLSQAFSLKAKKFLNFWISKTAVYHMLFFFLKAELCWPIRSCNTGHPAKKVPKRSSIVNSTPVQQNI